MLSVDAFLKTSSSLVLFVTQSALVSICCDVVINISLLSSSIADLRLVPSCAKVLARTLSKNQTGALFPDISLEPWSFTSLEVT